MVEEQQTKKRKSTRRNSETPAIRSAEDAATICRHIAKIAVENKLSPAWEGPFSHLWLYQVNSTDFMKAVSAEFPNGVFDMIFVDPPNDLANSGFTCRSGKQFINSAKNNAKKEEELSINFARLHENNLNWIKLCRDLLTPDGTLWISGTHHIIFSIGFALQSLGMRILNNITWEKTNPPPNLSCRYFTHSTETLIWAAKSNLSKHVFNDKRMRRDNNGKQMKSVWRITSAAKGEKKYGKNPTQKPISLLERIIKASTADGSIIFDPFTGSSTTGMAALHEHRYFIGCDIDKKFIDISLERLDREESPLVDFYI